MERAQKRNFIILGSVAGGLAALLALLMLVRTLSSAFADFVCRYVSRPWVYVVGHIVSLFPFSVFELCIIWLIAFAVALIVAAIILLVKKRGKAVLRGLCVAVICVLAAFNLYTLLAGFSYYRPAAPVPQSQTDYQPAQVTEIARYFADDYNALADKFKRDADGNVIPPYSRKEMSRRLQKEYAKLGSGYYYSYTPRAKGIFNSWTMTLNNITGITFVPLGEPNVNRNTPSSDIPQVMAHEMAHAKGVMREGEANFVSYYVLLSADDEYLRYCGYFAVFYALLPAVNANSSIKTDYNEIRRNMNPVIAKEQSNAYRFWSEKSKQPGLAGFINRITEKVGDFVNDLFLKSNGADNGSGSYSDKVSDGNTVIDIVKPDTGEIIYDVTYSSVQKMFFAVYEHRFLKKA